jgi:hypothetical protein
MSKFPLSKTREKCKKRRLNKRRGRSAVLNLTILILAGIVGIVYLIQTNFIAIEGYKIDELKKRIAELEVQNRRLEVNTLEFQSIPNMGDKMAELGMVEVDNVAHLDHVSSVVAVR